MISDTIPRDVITNAAYIVNQTFQKNPEHNVVPGDRLLGENPAFADKASSWLSRELLQSLPG